MAATSLSRPAVASRPGSAVRTTQGKSAARRPSCLHSCRPLLPSLTHSNAVRAVPVRAQSDSGNAAGPSQALPLLPAPQQAREESSIGQKAKSLAAKAAGILGLVGAAVAANFATTRPAYAQPQTATALATKGAAVGTSAALRPASPVIGDLSKEKEPVNPIDAADSAWILTSTALVLFMTLPGLSMFYAGLVKEKNVVSVFMQCFAIACVMSVLWAVCGYSMSFSTVGMTEGVTTFNSFIGGLDKVMLNGITDASAVGTLPEMLWVMFQMTFCIITPALMVGAFVERMKFSAIMLFCVGFALTIYFPVCHMIWAGEGAFFADMGVLDFAGGIVVHVTAAVAALVACIMVGPRKQNEMTPHNLPMTVAGAGMLWVGWYGFNGGSAAASGAAAATAIVVTQISAAMGAIVWTIWDQIEFGKPQSLGMATGCIAGLAAITPAAGFVGPIGAFIIGTISGILCRIFSLKIKQALNYDDSLDVFNVHGVGGFTGSILVGIFGATQFGGNQVGMNVATQLGVQTFAAVSTGLYTAVVSVVLLKIVGAVCGGLRVTDEEEQKGLDAADHDEEGYILDK